MTHYQSLLVAYAAAVAAWVIIWRLRPAFWPAGNDYTFRHPWRETGYALLACIGIIAIGQLYTAGIRLPTESWAGPLLESINQTLIFCPILLLLLIRNHPLETAWIKRDKIGLRLLTGLALALLALLVYSIIREGAEPWHRIIPRLYHYNNLGLATQVFLEDLAIAILATRLAAAIGFKATVALVAALFAAGHIPAMLANGATPAQLTTLLADTALGVIVISAALRSKDIWWQWPLHFTMDMTQFQRIAGIAS